VPKTTRAAIASLAKVVVCITKTQPDVYRGVTATSARRSLRAASRSIVFETLTIFEPV
jgi:hypothetical protein